MRPVRNLLRAVMLTLLLAASLPPILAAPLFKGEDRVVIYGDSITQQLLYSRYLQQYIFCRYPDMKIRFYNAGWDGDTAGRAYNRLERDVLVLNPTVVTLFFGMNDGGYKAVNDATVTTYRTNMEKLIKALQEKKIRVVVFSPGCVDYDRRPNLGTADYNKALEALGKAAEELAKKYNCPYADVHHAMLSFQASEKAKDSNFTMIPDSVHPNAAGHLVMAHAMLECLGAEPMPALGDMDISSGKGNGLKLVSKDGSKIVLETLGNSCVPFWFDEPGAHAMQRSGFINMAGQRLTVRGLTGKYTATIDGKIVGQFSADQLSSGVMIPGNYSRQGKLVHDMVANKERFYFSSWRVMRLGMADMPDIKKCVENTMENDDSIHNYIYKSASASAKMLIYLIPAPDGFNIARGKKYVPSDPNKFGWGVNGLLDGSWEQDSQHCWASGNSPKFPKTVTIDLEKTARINAVAAGVPNFGSTRTIKVAVSTDGKQYTEVGSHVFTQGQEERYIYKFAPVNARYVQLIYPDYYDKVVNYPSTFSFTTEVEVYSEDAPGS